MRQENDERKVNDQPKTNDEVAKNESERAGKEAKTMATNIMPISEQMRGKQAQENRNFDEESDSEEIHARLGRSWAKGRRKQLGRKV